MNGTREPETLVELLRGRAARHPDRTAFVFLLDGEEEGERLTYGALHREALRVAARLTAEGLRGERALLLFPPGLAFVAAYFGCLYAGVVAVPVYPPRSNRNLDRLQAIVADADARAVLATDEVIAGLARHLEAAPQLHALRWIACGLAAAGGDAPSVDAGVAPGDVAFLQYTSGSTSTPKGVRVTHANLLANERMLRGAFGHSEGLVVAGWLPVYHDMGLIGNVLHPLYMGGTCVLMSPTAFLQRPVRWLEAVSRWGARTSGGPNFAYELCADRVTEEEKARLDLGGWRVAFCGAEPVRARTLERFAEAFAGCGFRRDALYPCYGLAEATLFVTGGRAGDPPVVRAFDPEALERDRALPAPGSGGTALVGCGFPWDGSRVEIVRPEEGAVCAPGEVGEVWVAGAHVAEGYWNRPEESAATFGARLAGGDGPFLRTGDLGFVDGGELFVTGRVKDLVILRGRNLYPQDLEATAQGSHPALQPGGGAAFSVDVDGEERLVVVHEVRRTALRGLDAEAVARRIREEVAEAHEAQVHAVALIGPATLPKTSSGKVQRQACRKAYLAGGFDLVGGSVLSDAPAVPPPASDADPASAELEARLLAEAARALRVPAASLDPALPLTAQGLDSLSATQLAARVEEATGVPLDAVALLDRRSVRDLARELSALAPGGAADDVPAAEGAGEAPFPLSPGQQALWFLHRLAPASAAYNLAVAVRVRGALDARLLAEAMRTVAGRHAALRTAIDAEEPVQRVLPDAGWAPSEHDASGWSDDALRRRLDDEARRPFALGGEPPVRAELFRRGADDHVLLLAAHHVLLDFRSLEIVFDETFRAYAALAAGEAPALPEVRAQHPRFVRWQEALLAGPEGERLRDRWTERLAGAPTVLALPADRPRPAAQGHRGAAHPFALAPALAGRLRALARAEGVTPYTLLLAAFQALLGRWSGQADFLVGSPASGRARAAFAETVGYLVNPVVLRARLQDDPPFRAFLRRAQEEALGALAGQAYPFERLVEALHPERDASRTPVFQVLFVLQQADRSGAATACALGRDGVREERGPLVLESLSVETGAAQFDLALAMGEVEGTLAGSLRYDADLFEPATARRMAGHFVRLLEGIAAAPDTPVAALPLLPPEEERQVLLGFNATDARYPSAGVPLHRLVEAQAARTPDAVAAVFEGDALTYAELDRRAAALADTLRGLGVGPETRVGVCMERSPELVVALLGALKAGGAYVPLDPEYPAERLAYMLADSAVPVLVTQERVREKVAGYGGAVVVLDGGPHPAALEPPPSPTSGGGASPRGPVVQSLGAEPAALTPRPPLPMLGEGEHDTVEGEDRIMEMPLPRNGGGWRARGEPGGGLSPDGLAYVIYTSGSTGRPKGAMNAHRGVVNRLLWMQEEYGLGADDVVLQKTPFSFDVSVWEFFWPLMVGARLVLARPGGHRDPAYLSELMRREGVTTAHFVPSMLHAFLEAGGTGGPALRRVMCSGEALPRELAERFFAALPGVELHNLYGPTEAAVDVTYWACRPEDGRRGVPIGRPVANTRVYVLDARGEPAPVGVPGELFLGGVQVGRGYLGRPELTAERFVPDVFSPAPGARLYRTGDLARWREDGALEYLGRTDQQVKVRGFRIEPGEVEAALAAHPGVRECAVVAAEVAPGDARLAAYVVPRGEAPAVAELRAWLGERLPEHMVPAAWATLDALPLTPSGKLDRGALPRPEAGRGPGRPEHVAPRSATEETLAAIWAEVLGVERVGVHDNFFDLGGYSLLAVRVGSRVQAAFGVALPLHALFQAPTIEALSLRIARAQLEAEPEDEMLRLLAELEAAGVEE